MGTIGNTFDVRSVKYGHARKVWREINAQYPGGGVVSNIADWVDAGKIPAGTPVKFDISAKTIKAYTDAQVKESETASGDGAAAGVASLGINGYLEEDIVVASKDTVGTGTVIYNGVLYGYMFDADVLAALQKITTLPMILFVE